jgi:hypothetical protein
LENRLRNGNSVNLEQGEGRNRYRVMISLFGANKPLESTREFTARGHSRAGACASASRAEDFCATNTCACAISAWECAPQPLHSRHLRGGPLRRSECTSADARLIFAHWTLARRTHAHAKNAPDKSRASACAVDTCA